MLSGTTLSPAVISKKKHCNRVRCSSSSSSKVHTILNNGKLSKTASGSCCLRLKSKTQTVKPRKQSFDVFSSTQSVLEIHHHLMNKLMVPCAVQKAQINLSLQSARPQIILIH